MQSRDKNSKTTRRERLRQLHSGIKQHIVPAYPSVTITGASHKVTDIVSAIDDDIEKCDAAEQGHAAWLQAVEEERVSHLAVDPLITGVEQFVRLTFGNGEAQRAILADFGLTPHKKAVVTPKKRVEAAAKANVTRAVLHTMGDKQKKEALAQAASASAPTPPAAPGPAGTATAPATTANGKP
jgi:hypothetical protein